MLSRMAEISTSLNDFIDAEMMILIVLISA